MIRAIIDAPYLTYRAWCAGDGDQEILYKNTVTVLLDLLAQADEVWMVWEHRTPGTGLELRRQTYPDYKCRREPKASGYYQTIDVVQRILGPMGVHQAWPTIGEADDAAATLARRWAGNGDKVWLWVKDKDWLQLLTWHGVTALMPPNKGLDPVERVTQETMFQKFGLEPRYWTAFLALAGDRTDDIPGIAKIGNKRARQLLECCPELVELVLAGVGDSAVRQVAAKDASLSGWAQCVADAHEQLYTMFSLVTLRDVPVEIVRGNLDRESAPGVLEGLGCGWAVNRFLGAVGDDWDEDGPVDDWSE